MGRFDFGREFAFFARGEPSESALILIPRGQNSPLVSVDTEENGYKRQAGEDNGNQEDACDHESRTSKRRDRKHTPKSQTRKVPAKGNPKGDAPLLPSEESM